LPALGAALCRQIENADTPPSLEALARSAQLSPYHLHRIFKAVTGLTPKAYADGQRAHKVRQQLTASGSITEALYQAGYNASSRFYETAEQVLGMTPKAYRAAGADTQIRFAVGQCSLGAILVASSPRGVCAILLGDKPEPLVLSLQQRFSRAELIGDDPEFAQTVAQVVGFVEAPQQGLGLPLDIRGTAFQQRVWQALQQTTPGTTLSYSALARQIGAPTAVRAVAQACAANLLAVAIPCHRLVRNDGALSGYRWGVARKRQLLQREASADDVEQP
jgi:AraC family transcriptional regulator of adaptative response/methylated-DNA-[protein]-cysteine methyltransferase